MKLQKQISINQNDSRYLTPQQRYVRCVQMQWQFSSFTVSAPTMGLRSIFVMNVTQSGPVKLQLHIKEGNSNMCTTVRRSVQLMLTWGQIKITNTIRCKICEIRFHKYWLNEILTILHELIFLRQILGEFHVHSVDEYPYQTDVSQSPRHLYVTAGIDASDDSVNVFNSSPQSGHLIYVIFQCEISMDAE